MGAMASPATKSRICRCRLSAGVRPRWPRYLCWSRRMSAENAPQAICGVSHSHRHEQAMVSAAFSTSSRFRAGNIADSAVTFVSEHESLRIGNGPLRDHHLHPGVPSTFATIPARMRGTIRGGGVSRVTYPPDHIEADNRLCWMLGLMEECYGDEPLYVHIRRNEEDCIASFLRRWANVGGIGDLDAALREWGVRHNASCAGMGVRRRKNGRAMRCYVSSRA